MSKKRNVKKGQRIKSFLKHDIIIQRCVDRIYENTYKKMYLKDGDSNVFIFNNDNKVIDIEKFAKIHNISVYLVTPTTFKETEQIFEPPVYSKNDLPILKIKAILGLDVLITSSSNCITVKKIKSLHSLQMSFLKSVFQTKNIKFILATNRNIQVSLIDKKNSI